MARLDVHDSFLQNLCSPHFPNKCLNICWEVASIVCFTENIHGGGHHGWACDLENWTISSLCLDKIYFGKQFKPVKLFNFFQNTVSKSFQKAEIKKLHF